MEGRNLDEGAPLDELGDFKMPPLEELLKSLEGMESLSEEKKQELRDSLRTLSAEEKPDIAQNQMENSLGVSADLIILLILITIVALVFVFFGYKLYRSLAERERRKEEKKRQKQQKKKK